METSTNNQIGFVYQEKVLMPENFVNINLLGHFPNSMKIQQEDN